MMEIYEASDGKGKTILVLDKKEGILLVEAITLASLEQKRKKNLKKLAIQLNKEMAVY